MTKEKLKQWITELRSGKHTQCFGRVRDTDGSCCAAAVYLDFVQPVIGVADLLYPGELSESLYSKVIGWNDLEKFPFPVIADKLEEILNGN